VPTSKIREGTGRLLAMTAAILRRTNDDLAGAAQTRRRASRANRRPGGSGDFCRSRVILPRSNFFRAVRVASATRFKSTVLLRAAREDAFFD
jgi:hypothetical protein